MPSKSSLKTCGILLLQPPLTGRRVLAIDPGFKNGCKLAALDEFGALLDHSLIHVVGSDEQLAAGRAKLVELIRQHRAQRGRDRQRHRLPPDRATDRRDHRHRARRRRRPLCDRQRSRRQRLFHQRNRPRRVPAVRRHRAQRDLHRPPPAGSAQRAGEDRPGQHRRRPLSARHAAQAPQGHAR